MSRRRFQGSLGEFHRSVRGLCGSLCLGVLAEVQGLRKQSLAVIGDDVEVIQRSVGAQGSPGSFRPTKKVVLEFRDIRGHVKILPACSRVLKF